MNDLDRAEALYNSQLRLELCWHIVFTVIALFIVLTIIDRLRHRKSKDKPMDFSLDSITFDPQWSGE